MAKSKGMTRSELFREALRRYQRDEREREDLLAYGRRKAEAAGIRTACLSGCFPMARTAIPHASLALDGRQHSAAALWASTG